MRGDVTLGLVMEDDMSFSTVACDGANRSPNVRCKFSLDGIANFERKTLR